MNALWPSPAGPHGLFYEPTPDLVQPKRNTQLDGAFLGFPQFDQYETNTGRDNPFLPTWHYNVQLPQAPFSTATYGEMTATTQTEVKTTTKRARVQPKEDSSEGSIRSPLTAEICAGSRCTHEARFAMREQPKPKQRKSYKNENRYLLPNPTQVVLTEAAKGQGTWVTKAMCTVKLLDGLGNRLARQTGYYLEDVEGSLTKEMDLAHGAFDFSLKVRQNSGPEKFRLCFSINYGTSDGQSHKEKLISSPFLVQSNKSFFSKDPKVRAIHPSVGINLRPNELWIKGRDFNEKGVCVKIDGVEALVTEIQPNFIVVMTPPRVDLNATRTVSVSVANVFKQKVVASEQELEYTYVVTPADGMIHCDTVFRLSQSTTSIDT